VTTVRVPLDRLGVPLGEFAAVLNAAGHQWHAAQTNRYLGGVRATLEWVAGIHDRHPLAGGRQAGEAEAMLVLQMQADAIVYGWPEALPGIHREWALGVAAAIGWARGVQSRLPVRCPHQRAS
jgi:hypothetical protein